MTADRKCCGRLSELRLKVTTEWLVEWPLLKERWRVLLGLLICQYLHGVAVHTVYYLHKPGPLLRDIGFELLPALAEDSPLRSLTEMVTAFIICFGVLFAASPFWMAEKDKTFYSVNLATRTLYVLVICQGLRVVSFFSTVLPGPNYHCREGQATATLDPPESVWEVLDLSRSITHNCGDLIFSSHTIFMLTFLLNYQKYGKYKVVKRGLWALALATALLIIAGRKHYTVDIVIAWYTVPLVYWLVDRRLGDRDVHGERLTNLCITNGAVELASQGAGAGGDYLLPLYHQLPKGKAQGVADKMAAAAADDSTQAQSKASSASRFVALRMFELEGENHRLRDEVAYLRSGGTMRASAAGQSGNAGGRDSESGSSGYGSPSDNQSVSSEPVARPLYGVQGRGVQMAGKKMHRRDPSAPDLLSHESWRDS